MWNWLKSRSYQESRALMEFSVVQTDPTVYPVLSNFQRSEENLQVRVRGRSKCWVGLDYVSPTFRLVRFMVEKTATSPVGCVLERRGWGQVWDFLIGTHQKNTSVMQARFLKRQAGRVGVGVKAKRGPMAEEGSTRGSRKVQQFWGVGIFYCVRTAGNGQNCQNGNSWRLQQVSRPIWPASFWLSREPLRSVTPPCFPVASDSHFSLFLPLAAPLFSFCYAEVGLIISFQQSAKTKLWRQKIRNVCLFSYYHFFLSFF